MAKEEATLKVGERLRQDAVGDWHKADLGGRPLTLRILRADLAGQEHAQLLFEEEIRRVSRLDHPALLKILRVSRKPPRPWMLSADISTPSLADAVEQQGGLPPEEALALVRTLHDGFQYMEARKQVHAFPLPARIVRVDDGWRLLTFRGVRAWDELKSLKGKSHPAPLFAAPEQDRAHEEPLRPLPFCSWVLGSILRFAAGGGAPRTAGGAEAPLPEGFPEALAPIVARLCATDPEARPQGARAVREALDGGGSGGTPAVRRKPVKAPVPKRRRRG